MTLPYERTNSVNRTRKFLIDLMNPKETPRVPKDIRQYARSLLKHYPSEFEMDMACENEDRAAEAEDSPLMFRVFKKTF